MNEKLGKNNKEAMSRGMDLVLSFSFFVWLLAFEKKQGSDVQYWASPLCGPSFSILNIWCRNPGQDCTSFCTEEAYGPEGRLEVGYNLREVRGILKPTTCNREYWGRKVLLMHRSYWRRSYSFDMKRLRSWRAARRAQVTRYVNDVKELLDHESTNRTHLASIRDRLIASKPEI